MINQSNSVQNEGLQGRHFVILATIFIISITSLFMLYVFFPKIDPYVINLILKKKQNNLIFRQERDAFKIPKTIDDAKILGNILYKYSKHHRYIIMIAFFLTYIL